MDESLQEFVGSVKVGASAFKRESDGVDGGVGKRVKGDGDSGGNWNGDSSLLAPAVESGSLPPEVITKKRKPRARTNNPKGGWTQPEDDIILDGRKKNKSWQEITNAVNFLKDGGKARTLTAVRLRYQKVLKDRGVELTPEQLEHLRQAKRDVEGSEKFRFVAERFKELAKIEISRTSCQNILSADEKGEPAPAAKPDPESDPSFSSTTSSSSSSSSSAAHTTPTATTT
ncbi:hypothetical protein B9Z19DRAFT_1196834 [Tuber borchii]|uniref:Myb-like domain-containing protein n=1 Tax=Tuber borchii TaxID=42251 RepID=A0A2T6ZDV5_TUBBO|nr:hypothetical protein B9Z19DRAFT_1196834 [Tuber borchii]